MMKAIPKKWFSSDYLIMKDAEQVAEIEVSSWREKGQLWIDGGCYDVYREGLVSGLFILKHAGSVVASAEKPSALHRMFTISYDDSQYTLKAKSAFSQSIVLLRDDHEVGCMSSQGFFTGKKNIDLPAYLPTPVRVFMIWLAVVLWKRESNSTGHA